MTNPTPEPPAPTPNVSETPRTDAIFYAFEDIHRGNPVVRSDFARQLERELAAVTKERDEWKTMAMKLDAAVLAEQVHHVKTCGFLEARTEQLTAALARAEKAEEALREISTVAHCISLSGPATTPTLQDAWSKFDRISVMATAALTPIKEPTP